MLASVCVLKFLSVNGDWFTLGHRYDGPIWVRDQIDGPCRSEYCFLVYNFGKLLVYEDDVKPTSTLWTVSKEIHSRVRELRSG